MTKANSFKLRTRFSSHISLETEGWCEAETTVQTHAAHKDCCFVSGDFGLKAEIPSGVKECLGD